MGWQIVKQPDGKWGIWSTVTDTLIHFDGTRDEVIGAVVGQETQNAYKRAMEAADDAEAGLRGEFDPSPAEINRELRKARKKKRP